MKTRVTYHPWRFMWFIVCVVLADALFEDQWLTIIYGAIMAGVAGQLFPFKTIERIKDEQEQPKEPTE